MCSVLISLGSFLGGVFFDAEATGGVVYKICRCMPFIYCTKLTRSSIDLDLDMEHFVLPFIIITAVAAVLVLLASALFKSRMNADR